MITYQGSTSRDQKWIRALANCGMRHDGEPCNTPSDPEIVLVEMHLGMGYLVPELLPSILKVA